MTDGKFSGTYRGVAYDFAADGTLSLERRVPDVWRDEIRLFAAPEFLASKGLSPAQRDYWRAVSRVEVRA